MKLKDWKKFLPIIGIALFVYILVKIGISNVLREILKANLLFFFLALLLMFPLLLTQTFKWFAIARKQKIEVPFWRAFKINLITCFYSFITPSKLGTIMRAEYLRKYTKNIGKGISNFVLDKILDTASVFFIAILFSFIFQEFSFLPRFYFIIIFLAIVFLTFIFIKKERSRFLLGIFFRKLLPERLKKKAEGTFDGFYEDMPRKRYFVWFFLLNVITWMILYVITFFTGKAVGINLNFVYFLAVLPLGTLVSLIPVTINGLGTREATLIVLFGLFGVGAEKVLSMSVLFLIVSGILPAIIGGFLSLKNKD